MMSIAQNQTAQTVTLDDAKPPYLSGLSIYASDLLESVNDAVIITDANQCIRYWNAAAERMYEWDREQVIGKSIFDILGEINRNPGETESIVESLLRSGKWQGEMEHQKSYGTLYVQLSASLLWDKNGQVAGFVAVNRDISTSKRLENELKQLNQELSSIIKSRTEELRKSEEHYRLLTENSNDLVTLHNIDAGFSFSYVSPSAVSILGYEPSELIGRPLLDIIHPDDREHVIETASKHLGQPGAKASTSYRAIRKDGTHIWVESLCSFLLDTESGKPVSGISTTRDITAHKRLEIELQEKNRIFEQAEEVGQMGSWITTIFEDGRTHLDWSAETQRIFGFIPGEFDGKAETFISLIHPEDRERILESAEKGAATLQPFTNEFRVILKDGTEKWLYEKIRFELLDGKPIRFIGVIRDITQQKKNENRILKLASVLESSSDLVWLASLDGKIEYLNPGGRRILGIDENISLTGCPTLDFIDEAHCQIMQTVVMPAVWKDGSYEGEFFLRHSVTGKPIPLYQNCFLIRDENDKPIAIANVCKDMSALYEANAKLKLSEERYRMLIQEAPECIVLRDDTGCILAVNDHARDLLGYSPEELIGRVLFGLIEESDLRNNPIDHSAFSKGEVVRTNRNFIHKDGHIINTEVVARRLSDGMIQTIIRDNTERLQWEEKLSKSEKHFRSLIENANDSISILDEGLRYSYLSPGHERILGYKGDWLIGKSAFALIHQDDIDRVKEALSSIFSKTGTTATAEFRIMHESGHWVWLNATGKSFYDDEGILRVLVNSRDITESKENEAKLEELDHELDTLLYRSSHDLRGPICSMKGLIDLIKSEGGESIMPFAEKLDQALNKQEAVINDLVTITQLKSSNLSIELVDIEKTVQKIIGDSRLMPGFNKIRLEVDFDRTPLISDSRLLTSILQNLVQNAVKYHNLEDKSPWIRISHKRIEHNHFIEVEDNGPGIHEELHERIFDMFYRGNKETEGTGLGLYMVRKNAEKLGGSVYLESRPGHGSRFTVALPVKAPGRK